MRFILVIPLFCSLSVFANSHIDFAKQQIADQLHAQTLRIALDQPQMGYPENRADYAIDSSGTLSFMSFHSVAASGAVFAGAAISGPASDAGLIPGGLGASAGMIASTASFYLLARSLELLFGPFDSFRAFHNKEGLSFLTAMTGVTAAGGLNSLLQTRHEISAERSLFTGPTLSAVGLLSSYTLDGSLALNSPHSKNKMGSIHIQPEVESWIESEAQKTAYLLRVELDGEKTSIIRETIRDLLYSDSPENLFRSLSEDLDPVADPEKIERLRIFSEQYASLVLQHDPILVVAVDQQIEVARQVLNRQIQTLEVRPKLRALYEEALETKKRVELQLKILSEI